MSTRARRRGLLPILAVMFAGLPGDVPAQSGTPTITIVATDSLASEPTGTVVLPPGLVPGGGLGAGEFTIRLSQRTSTALTIAIDVSGTARARGDYASVLSGASAVTVPTSVTIPEGASSTTFTIVTKPNTGGQVVTIGVGARTASVTITP